MKYWHRWLLRAAVLSILSCMPWQLSQAQTNPFALVQPNEWSYKAVVLLVKHGVITDTKGLALGRYPYARYELLPLVIEATDKREQLNDNDKALANRLFTEYADDIMYYKIDGPQALPVGEGEKTLPPLTKEEIAEKMKNFKIDDSRVRVQSDIRIRYISDGHKDKTDSRTRVELSVPLA